MSLFQRLRTTRLKVLTDKMQDAQSIQSDDLSLSSPRSAISTIIQKKSLFKPAQHPPKQEIAPEEVQPLSRKNVKLKKNFVMPSIDPNKIFGDWELMQFGDSKPGWDKVLNVIQSQRKDARIWKIVTSINKVKAGYRNIINEDKQKLKSKIKALSELKNIQTQNAEGLKEPGCQVQNTQQIEERDENGFKKTHHTEIDGFKIHKSLERQIDKILDIQLQFASFKERLEKQEKLITRIARHSHSKNLSESPKGILISSKPKSTNKQNILAKIGAEKANMVSFALSPQNFIQSDETKTSNNIINIVKKEFSRKSNLSELGRPMLNLSQPTTPINNTMLSTLNAVKMDREVDQIVRHFVQNQKQEAEKAILTKLIQKVAISFSRRPSDASQFSFLRSTKKLPEHQIDFAFQQPKRKVSPYIQPEKKKQNSSKGISLLVREATNRISNKRSRQLTIINEKKRLEGDVHYYLNSSLNGSSYCSSIHEFDDSDSDKKNIPKKPSPQFKVSCSHQAEKRSCSVDIRGRISNLRVRKDAYDRTQESLSNSYMNSTLSTRDRQQNENQQKTNQSLIDRLIHKRIS